MLLAVSYLFWNLNLKHVSTTAREVGDAAGREAMNVNFELILGQAGDVFRTHNVHACGDR